jgi:outer membrane protein assembly factor BamB
VLVGATLAGVPRPLAQERADWSQFQGGPGHPGTLADGPEPPYVERWRLVAGDEGDRAVSGVAILDGVAYTVGDRAVYAVDLDTGDVAWTVPRAGGPLSVPAVVAGRGGDPATLLYLEGPAGSTDDEASPTPRESPSPEDEAEGASDLVARELEGRTELWRVALAGISRTGVTVMGDTAFVGDESGTVHAISVSDGRVRWSAEVAAPVDVPLAVADGLVLVAGRDAEAGSVELEALDQPTGERRWRVSPQVTSTAVSAPAAADGLTVFGLADRYVRGLDGDGQQVWAHLALSIFSPASSPALHSGTLVIADLNGGLYRLDARGGARDWGFQLNDVVLRSSPVVSGDTILLGLNDGRLVAIDAASGRLVWRSPRTPGLVGTIALARDVVVAVKGGSEAGLIAFEHDPGGALLDEPSPTVFDPATTLPRAGAAIVIALVVVLVPGFLARRRFGDATPDEADEDELEGVEA